MFLFQFVGFVQEELKTNFKQTRIHCAQVQYYYLKIPEVMLRRLFISRTPSKTDS